MSSRQPSEKTFNAEYHAVGSIPGLLYEHESEYTQIHGNGFEPIGCQPDVCYYATDDNREVYYRFPGDRFSESQVIPESRNIYSPGLHDVHDTALVSDQAFVETVLKIFDVDLVEASKHYDRNVGSGRRQPANLAATFGTDAFGTYLPWHAFCKSNSTPWGMYLFLTPLWEWAQYVHMTSPNLPTPKPSVITVLRLLIIAVYRHELFHYHVERFALRQEVVAHKPLYRPYVDDIESKVQQSKDWLEEALAQAVVLNSRLVSNRSGFSQSKFNNVLEPLFRSFPPGYRDFDCHSHGGVQPAHRKLSSQVTIQPSLLAETFFAVEA